MTDSASAERIAALQRRRAGAIKRRRPAEASRVLIAGAGTAAILTMVTAMAQADQAAEAPDVLVAASPLVGSAQASFAVSSALTTVTDAPPPEPQNVQTITIARPVRAQVSNGRTNASR